MMKILKLKDIIELTKLSKSTIYLYISENRFPKQVKLGSRAVGWLEYEVLIWIQSKINEAQHEVYRKAS